MRDELKWVFWPTDSSVRLIQGWIQVIIGIIGDLAGYLSRPEEAACSGARVRRIAPRDPAGVGANALQAYLLSAGLSLRFVAGPAGDSLVRNTGAGLV